MRSLLTCKVSPGYRKTDLGGAAAEKVGAGDPAKGALSITKLALMDDDGPTGQFYSYTGEPWLW